MKKEEVKTKVPTWAWMVMAVFAAIIIINLFGDSLFSYENKQERGVRGWLEDDGYEVIDVMQLNNNSVLVNMKSFGSITEQVENALLTLNYFYPEVEEYSIFIYTPTKTCYYSTQFLLYNSLRKSEAGEEVYVDEKGNIESLIFDKLAENTEEYSGYKLNLSKYPVDKFTLYKMYEYLLNDPMHCK